MERDIDFAESETEVNSDVTADAGAFKKGSAKIWAKAGDTRHPLKMVIIIWNK